MTESLAQEPVDVAIEDGGPILAEDAREGADSQASGTGSGDVDASEDDGWDVHATATDGGGVVADDGATDVAEAVNDPNSTLAAPAADEAEDGTLEAMATREVSESSVKYGTLDAVVPEANKPYVTLDGTKYDVTDEFDFSQATSLYVACPGRHVSYSLNEDGLVEWVSPATARISDKSSSAKEKSSSTGSNRNLAASEAKLNALDRTSAFTWDTTKLTPYFTKGQISEMSRFVEVWASLIAVSQDSSESFDQKVMKKVLDGLGVSLTSYLGIMDTLNAEVDIKAKSVDGAELTVGVSMRIQSYILGENDPYAALGQVSFTVEGKGVHEEGVGLVTYADMETFCKSFKSVVMDAITDEYGEMLKKSAKRLAGAAIGTINKYVDGEYAKKALGPVYTLNEAPAESSFKKAVVKCPVDVEVYDSTGDLCARTVGGVVDGRYDDVIIYTDGDDKCVILEGDDYVLRLVGTDSGTMEYDVEEYVDEVLARRVVSKNVKLSEGIEYYALVPDPERIDNRAYMLCDGDGNDVKLTSDSIGDVSEANQADDGICGYAVVDGEGVMTYCAFDPGDVEGEKYPIYESGKDRSWCSSELKTVRFAGGYKLRPLSISWLLHDCPNLVDIDISGIDTSSVTDMSYTFFGCHSLQSLDLSGWDTSSVTSFAAMFDGCSKLVSLDLSGWDTSSATSFANMFSGCPFESLRLSDWDTGNVENMSDMFLGCKSLENLDLSGWDTKSVVNMIHMFSGCSSLGSLRISDWDTGKVESTSNMFYGCKSLENLDLSGWDTSSVTSMGSMFSSCTSLDYLDLSGWDTGKVKSMGSMFSSCTSLDYLDLSGWDTGKVKSMSYMFHGCSSLSSLDLSGWNTSLVTDVSYTFSGCSSLSSLDLSGWDTSSVTKTDSMFRNCSSLARWKVGSGYMIVDESMVPYGKQVNGRWWSIADGAWYTREEIASSRSGVADTYTKEELHQTSLSKATIAKIPDQAYNGGSEVRPKPTVTMGGATLESGRDYAVSYKDNKAEGTATLTVTGKGSYTGSKSAKFTIRYMKPSWSGASRMPVGSTATFKVTNGGYVRVKSGGKRAKSDSVVSISGKTVTAKKAGTTTVYLLDSKGKQVASKKVTVFAIHGKTWEFESSVDSSYVLDIQGGSTKDGAQMIVYKRNGGKNQQYQIYRQDDGTYAIRSLKSKKWLTVESKTNKYVQQMSWKGNGSQKWNLTVDSSNRVTFVNVGTNKCFDVQGGKTKNSAKMIVWQSNGGKNQKWVLNQK